MSLKLNETSFYAMQHKIFEISAFVEFFQEILPLFFHNYCWQWVLTYSILSFFIFIFFCSFADSALNLWTLELFSCISTVLNSKSHHFSLPEFLPIFYFTSLCFQISVFFWLFTNAASIQLPSSFLKKFFNLTTSSSQPNGTEKSEATTTTNNEGMRE